MRPCLAFLRRCAILHLLGLAGSAACADSTLESYAARLNHLATSLGEQVGDDAANAVATWAVERGADRQTLFLTRPRSESAFAGEDWWRAFLDVRKRQAALLWDHAEEALESGDLETAVQTVHEILREDPTDERAAKMLRAHMFDPTEVRSKPVRAAHRELNWRAGNHFLITTPHFVINTNHSEVEGRRLAALLEETYQLWAQVFVRHWTDIGAVRRAFADRALPSPSRTRHRVVLFATQAGYTDHLKKREPQIEVSKGLYRPSDRTAYFFAGDALEPYWRHETVHQLLSETGRTPRIEPAPGADSHAWLVEGIAIYFESTRRVGDHFELGGFESPRLQYARYRMLQEGFYVPWPELSAMGREALKRDPRIRKIYTQAAGLTHFLMDGQGGKLRGELIELVRQMYQEPRAAERSTLLSDESPRGIEQQYRTFLNVDNAQMHRLNPTPSLTSLCLGQTMVTDDIAEHLASLSNLGWLDLAGCDIGDETVLAIPLKAPLKQLSLQGTMITDASLEHIAELKTIEELDLSDTPVSDKGVRQLATLTNLRTLWLSGTHVTDQGVSELRSLATLENLDIGQTAVTSEAGHRLQQQMPAQ